MLRSSSWIVRSIWSASRLLPPHGASATRCRPRSTRLAPTTWSGESSSRSWNQPAIRCGCRGVSIREGLLGPIGDDRPRFWSWGGAPNDWLVIAQLFSLTEQMPNGWYYTAHDITLLVEQAGLSTDQLDPAPGSTAARSSPCPCRCTMGAAGRAAVRPPDPRQGRAHHRARLERYLRPHRGPVLAVGNLPSFNLPRWIVSIIRTSSTGAGITSGPTGCGR